MRVQHALSARSGRVVLIAETTILFSTQAEVVRYRKCLAAQAADSALGVNVTTPNALVEELWEVWGTGERLVSDTQRRLIIKQLLAEQSDWVDSPEPLNCSSVFCANTYAKWTKRFSVLMKAISHPAIGISYVSSRSIKKLLYKCS